MALTKAHNRMIEGSAVNVLDFGAVADGVTDDSAAIQAAIDYAEARGLSIHIPGGTYGVGSTINVFATAATKIYGDGIRETVLKKLADVPAIVYPQGGPDNGIFQDFKVEGRGNADPNTNTIENTAGIIFYRKFQAYNLFVQYCGGPAFSDPYPQTLGVTKQGYGIGILNDSSNTNVSIAQDLFVANCYGDAVYVGVVAGVRDCNGMKIHLRSSFENTGFAINAQKGFRNYFEVQACQGSLHDGVCLAADTDNFFDVLYVEKGNFSGRRIADAQAARNTFRFQDASGMSPKYDFSANANNTFIDVVGRETYTGGTPIYEFTGDTYSYMDGLRVGGNAAANSMEEYEFGTWTVNLYDAISGGNVSPTSVTGYYTKVGNTVHCSFSLMEDIDTTGMTGGLTCFVTLPFVAATSSAKGTSAGSIAVDTVTFPASTTMLTPTVGQASARGAIIASGSGVADVELTVAAFTSGTSDIVRYQITYFTN